MLFLFLFGLVLVPSIGNAQVTIAIQDFDGATPTMTYTGGAAATGNGLFPSTPKYVSTSNGRQINNSTSNITFATVNTTSYTSINYSVRLASFAGTSGNGADGSDNVVISISTDGGISWSQELQINGNSNARWGFSGTNAGTGTATVAYDGDNTPATSTPAGGGYRGADGYTNLSVTGLPATASLRVRMEFSNNSANEYWVIDDAKIEGVSAGPCVEPGAPTSLTISNETETTMDLSWSGGGPNYLVVVHQTSAVTANPTDASTYTANAAYGSGDDIGTNEYVVYNSTGTSVTVTGLTGSTDYYYTVFSYDCSPEDYETGGSSANSTTLAPSSCSSIFSDDFGSGLGQWSNNTDWVNTAGEMQHDFAAASGNSYNYADIGSQNLTASDYEWEFCMRNGAWDPSGSNDFAFWLISDATNLLGAANGYAVGVNQSGTSDEIMLYSVTGGTFTPIITLASATFNWGSADDVCFRITRTAAGSWELFYNPNGGGEASAGTVSNTTHTSGQYIGPIFDFSSTRADELWIDDVSVCGAALCTGPTTQATFTSFTSVTSSTFTINFAAGTGGNGRIVVIRDGTAIASSPTSGTTYTANTTFGSGSDISGGSGEYVVYDGTGTSVNVTGLTANTTYHVAIFEYVTGGATDPCYDGSLSGNIGNTTTPCSAAAEPTTASSSIVFSNIACTSMDIDWTSGNGANVIVVASTNPITGNPSDQTNYTGSATFGAGNTLNAGEFVIYNGSGTSVSLSSLLAGTTYYFEIFDYNGVAANCNENYLTSSSPTDNEPTLAVCTDPELTAVLVDACGGSVEGINEFFTFQNGNTDFEIDSLNVNYPFNGPYCNPTCGSGFVTNPTYVNSLNTTAGCAGLFVEVDPIPASAKAIVFTGALPTYAFDFAGLCGTGPYYAVFTDNAGTTGRFANYNATCSGRTLTVDFGAMYTDAVTYDRCLLANTDGDYVTFAADGTPSYSNDGCTPTATLPVSLLNFSGYGDNSANFLNWSTTSEINNDYFDIERSSDGFNFQAIGLVYGNGTSTSLHDYDFIDESPEKNLNYYRLKQVDFNGNHNYSNTIVIKSGLDQLSIWHADNLLHISAPNNMEKITQVNIFNVIGQLVYSSSSSSGNSLIETNELDKAIYLIQVKTENTSFIKKIKF